MPGRPRVPSLRAAILRAGEGSPGPGSRVPAARVTPGERTSNRAPPDTPMEALTSELINFTIKS